jgi:hypothetical protein
MAAPETGRMPLAWISRTVWLLPPGVDGGFGGAGAIAAGRVVGLVAGVVVGGDVVVGAGRGTVVVGAGLGLGFGLGFGLVVVGVVVVGVVVGGVVVGGVVPLGHVAN